jgi:hypothetical protein
MPDTRQQFAARIKTEAAKHIMETPPGSNVCEITHRFAKRFGWGDREPWCAETVTVVGLDAGVLPASCASAGAWDLTDRMARAGLGRTLKTIHLPGVISFNYGHGHAGFLLGYNPISRMGLTWEGNTGDGNPAEGDGCYYRNRYLGPGVVHGLGDLEFAADAKGVTHGKPVDRFLYEKTPPFVGLDVKGVANALIVAGNPQLKTDPSYTKGVYTHTLAQLVNLFNERHHILDPKTKQPAHGVTAASLAELRAIVH